MNRDRARGTLLGLAVGDALGTTLEFSTRTVPDFPTMLAGPHRDITGGGPFGLVAGQVTDDTHMACCLAASLAARAGFEAADVARRYVEWREHTFDIGATTSSAVRRLERGELDAGRKVWEESGRRGAANGSLMRAAPIGVFFASDDKRRRQAALADSALTHFDPRCQLACAAFTAAIAHEGETVAAAVELSRASEELAASFPELESLILAGAQELRDDLRLATEDDPQLGALIHTSQGFVRVAFRAAFWELEHAPGFAAGLVDVVNRGGDADTNGAIAGALLGARHGEAAIPEEWRRQVLGALQDRPAGALRDAYHPKVLLAMLEPSQ